MNDKAPDFRATVRHVEKIGRRYAVIEAQTSDEFRHKPGQFTKVSFTDQEGSFDRFYSIASAPTGDGRFELCLILDDERLRRIVESWSKDSSFTCSLPGGRFPIPAQQRSIVCIAGGSGITPLRAIIQDRVNQGVKAPTVLLYGCQSDDEIPFYSSFATWQNDHRNFKLVVYADETPLGRALRGRPLNHLQKHVVPDADYLLCGPPGFMDSARRLLEDFGIAKDAIHQDRF